MKPIRVAVVGPGAIGTTLAAFLRRAGARVEVVGRRAGRVSAQGLPFRASPLPVRSKPSQVADLVFFCVKSGDTAAAAARARKAVGDDTAVISLQNGLTHRPALIRAFGRRRCVFGICVIGAERVGPSLIRYHGGRGVAVARLAANRPAAERAAACLRQAGLSVELGSSEEKILWTKAAFNAATNPLGALTCATNGDLIGAPALRELTLKALGEAVLAARAAGHAVSYAPLARKMEAGLAAMPAQANSMLQDLRAGRPTELGAIVKPLLDAARRKRVATPLLDSLYRFTRRLERELA